MYGRWIKVLGSACLGSTLVCSFNAVPCFPQEELTAEKILQRMAGVYAGSKTYRDSGIVKTTYIDEGGRTTEENPFKTAFVRPDRFRFEFSDGTAKDLKRYVVWRNGKEVSSWWDVKPGVKKEDSLSSAIAGATGVSGGSAHMIPKLLMPDEIGGAVLSNLKGATRAVDRQLEDVHCYCIKGTRGDSPTTLWIEKKGHLIRRIDSSATFKDFRTETTTIYDPELDGKISDDALAFNSSGSSEGPIYPGVVSGWDLVQWSNKGFPKEDPALNLHVRARFRWITPKEVDKDTLVAKGTNAILRIEFDLVNNKKGASAMFQFWLPDPLSGNDASHPGENTAYGGSTHVGKDKASAFREVCLKIQDGKLAKLPHPDQIHLTGTLVKFWPDEDMSSGVSYNAATGKWER